MTNDNTTIEPKTEDKVEQAATAVAIDETKKEEPKVEAAAVTEPAKV